MKHTVVCLATVVLGLAAMAGCRQSGTEGRNTNQDSHSEMIEHIGKEHAIRIGADTNADVIVVSASNNTFSVTFTPGLIKRLPQDCLHVLDFPAEGKVLTDEQYDKLLNDFHDYLLLTYGEGHGPKP